MPGRGAKLGEDPAMILRRGYTPSIPVAATQYDLVVESDDGLRRVQAKTTTSKDNGRWAVRIARMGVRLAPSARTKEAEVQGSNPWSGTLEQLGERRRFALPFRPADAGRFCGASHRQCR